MREGRRGEKTSIVYSRVGWGGWDLKDIAAQLAWLFRYLGQKGFLQ